MRHGTLDFAACSGLRFALALLATGTLGAAQLCTSKWLGDFDPHVITGTIRALQVYDDGLGERLYAGGDFAYFAASPTHIARWDGAQWSALSTDVDAEVSCLVVHDDGSGPALYAGGSFLTAGGAPAAHVARWNGATWSALGGGVDGPVHALCTYDDGTGPALYVGGAFTHAGGLDARCLARWRGGQWSEVGGGVAMPTTGPVVRALQVHDDGGGSALFAAGKFTQAGSTPAQSVARWRQGQWSALGSGSHAEVHALASYPLAGTNRLVAAIDSAVLLDGISAWDGQSWSALGGAFPADTVRAFAVDASAPGNARLYCSGTFTSITGNKIAVLDGAQWSPLGSGVAPGASGVFALASYAAAGGSKELCVGGSFATAGGAETGGFARWNGVSWVHESDVFSDRVRAVAHRALPGGGEELFVGGEFTKIGTLSASRVARWDGSQWQALGSGINGAVHALCAFDEGGTSWIVTGGLFSAAGGVAATCVARWDGSAWSAMGDTLTSTVRALAVHDDGSGPRLYSGSSTWPGGVRRWDGSSWNPVGTTSLTTGVIYALATYDNGTGSKLFAGGELVVGGLGPSVGSGLAAWDGAQWLGFGMTSDHFPVRALAVATLPGHGPELYVGGDFTTLCGAAIARIGRFDGSSFQQVGAGFASGIVQSLHTVEQGGTQTVLAGGSMPGKLMRWNGSTWSTGPGVPDAPVDVIDEFTPAGAAGPWLVVGGGFTVLSESDSPYFGAFVDCAGAGLAQDVAQISVSAGGAANWTLLPGPGFGGAPHWLLGSITGWSPGMTVHGWNLPLVFDPLFEFTLAHPNSGWYAHTHALVDPSGKSFARLVVPAAAPAALIGTRAYHAYFVYDVFLGTVVFTSNAVQLDLAP